MIATSGGSLIGPDGLVKELTKALVERMLAGEMTIAVPRDRHGTFGPKLIEKHQTRFEGFDSKMLSMYALGMTVRDIQGHLYDIGVDPDFETTG